MVLEKKVGTSDLYHFKFNLTISEIKLVTGEVKMRFLFSAYFISLFDRSCMTVGPISKPNTSNICSLNTSYTAYDRIECIAQVL